MREYKDNFVYVNNIYEAIQKILDYTLSHNFDDFAKNEWDQSAIVRYFEIIGEATTRLDAKFKNEHAEIEWRDISDFRNFLIHDYMDIDIKIVWDTMTINLPPLKKKVDNLLQNYKQSEK